MAIARVFTEVEHFDRIQHVNQLAEDIENHRQVSAKLREEIGRYDNSFVRECEHSGVNASHMQMCMCVAALSSARTRLTFSA